MGGTRITLGFQECLNKIRFVKRQGHGGYTLGVKCAEPRFRGTKPCGFHGRFGAQKAQWACMNARSSCLYGGAANVSALGVSEKKRKRRFYHTSFCCYYCYVYPVRLRGGFYPKRGRRSPIQLLRATRLLSPYLLS